MKKILSLIFALTLACVLSAQSVQKFQVALKPTAVQTGPYSAAVNDLVPVDTTAGAVTITLPTAPPDQSMVSVKQVIQGSTNAVSVVTGGSDVFNRTGGGTTFTISLSNQGATFQYSRATAIWYVVSDDLPRGSLLAFANTWSGAQTFSAAESFAGSFPQATFGVNATTKGGIKMFGNTSGDVTIGPLAVAGTATSLTFPAVSGGLIASVTAIGTVTGTPTSSNFLRGDGTWATPTGSGTVNSGTANQIAFYSSTGTAVSGDTLLTDSGTSLGYTGTAGVSAPSFNGTGTTPAALTLAAGTGSIPALASNSAGFAAPTTGGTSYLLKLPSTITAGVPIYAAPAINDGVNESAISVVAPGTSGNVLTSNGTTWTSAAATGSVANPTATIGLAAVNGSATSAIRSDGAPALSQAIAPTWSAAHIFSVAGAASTPAIKVSGVPFAGTGTTSFPQFYINDNTATASTTLSTAGTYFGINGHGSPDLVNLMLDGANKFKVASTGATTVASTVTTTGSTSGAYEIDGITSGKTIYTTADATAQTVTVTTAAQTTGGSTLTIPDQAGTNRNFVFDTLTQTLTNKTLTTPVVTAPNSGLNNRFRSNSSVSAQAPAATTRTYITGSDIGAFTAGQIQVGTVIYWELDVTKTAAGTATSTFDIAFGTAGTTADTARVSFTKPAGAANADHCLIKIKAVVKTNSASGVVIGDFTLFDDQTGVGGFLASGKYISSLTNTSSTFDTTAPTHIGLCITTGASDAYTINSCVVRADNL